MNIQAIHIVKSLIAECAAMTCLIAYHLNCTPGNARHYAYRTVAWGVLTLLAALSVLAYFDFGHYAPVPLYVNRHDLFHYYMGSKYSKEVGYLNLYPCAVIADQELGQRYNRTTIRSQVDYSFVSTRVVLTDKEYYLSLFSKERWAEFVKDIQFFREFMGNTRWQRSLSDKGYNATPAWNVLGSSITNRVEIQKLTGLYALISLDIILLGLGFGMIFLVFGYRTGVLCVLFFGVNFMMNETHIKGSLLRMDWLVCLVMAVCLLKRNHFNLAGVLLGYACVSRIFPVVFAFAPLSQFLYVLVTRKSADPALLRFLLSLAATTCLLVAFSASVSPGTANWRVYINKIRMHDNDVVGVRTGFKYVFLGTSNSSYGNLHQYKEKMNQKFGDLKVEWYLVITLVLAGFAYCARGLDTWEAVAIGFVPFYFVIAPTFYYYVVLIVPVLMFAWHAQHSAASLSGYLLALILSVAGYNLRRFMPLDFALFYWNSVMYLILAIWLLVVARLTRQRMERVVARIEAETRDSGA